MKHLVKLMSEDCTYMCVINPDHIVKFYEEDDVCCIKLSTGETFATKVKLDDLRDLIEPSGTPFVITKSPGIYSNLLSIRFTY